LAAANEATKNIKIKSAAKRQKKRNNQQKTSGLDDRRWDGTRAQLRAQGERESVILGAIELGGGGQLR
jgi:hypothetical protein